ncbi:MAG: DUF2235 domain-containing protein [Leptolyngbyaceae bacterium]|nr:DUF2235 domain-containing protein [Leptolyngbyaceae bacterium]
MKRLIVCCDGTWQDRDRSDFPTNVPRVFDAVFADDYDHPSKPTQYAPHKKKYIRGLGTDSLLERLPGGAFGKGIDEDILDAYAFLSDCYEPGDQIYLFGFSRGAYTVRSLAGLIYCSGLVAFSKLKEKQQEAYEIYRSDEIKPGHPTAVAFRKENGDRVPITFLGCWDTVGSLGIPDLIPWLPINQWVNRKYEFHDTELSFIIQQARHAVAIDERRRPLNITPMLKTDNPAGQNQVIKQVWFPGVHGCVGGGTLINRHLSDQALVWMLEEAQPFGLEYDLTLIKDGVKPDHKAAFDSRLGLLGLAGANWRSLREYGHTFEDLHVSTKERWRDLPDYRSPNLQEAFGKELDAYSTQLSNR